MRKFELINDEGTARKLMLQLFDAAVAAADPLKCVPPHLPNQITRGRVVVIGAGKASAAMAVAVEGKARRDGWFERLEGVVVTRYAHGVPCERIDIVEAGHPEPDMAGTKATQRVLALVDGLVADDLLICLISGGGSALLTAPANGVSHHEKAAINRALLRSGAPIGEMNCVRKHISAIKGGRLARRAKPARVLCLMISDVPGDDPSVIASGPTVPDPTSCQDALNTLARYRIKVPASVSVLLNNDAGETPKEDDPAFGKVENVIIARPADMMKAAEDAARYWGLDVISLGADLGGEARLLGGEHAVLARELRKTHTYERPFVILSGGETTVTVTGQGRGGRNAEYALGLAQVLDGASGIYAIACDTDGIDGLEDNAGVIVTPDSLKRATAARFDVADVLACNDAYSLFAAIDDLVVTGPTRTNVNDFRAILVI